MRKNGVGFMKPALVLEFAFPNLRLSLSTLAKNFFEKS
jgi:hypothetical protein